MNSNITWQEHNIPGIWVGDTGQPGPEVAIIGGVHGDELGGIMVAQQSKEKINAEEGVVYLIEANLEAIAMGDEGQRATVPGLNLNRQFRSVKNLQPKFANMDPADWPYEVKRGLELAEFLEKPEIVGSLDLHDFKNPNGPIFMITEERGFAIARAIGAPIISSGWSTAEPGGSDYFMETMGKVGICYELGYKKEPTKVLDRGHDAVARFLVEHEMVEGNLSPMFDNPTFIRNIGATIRRTEQYELLLPEDIKTFDELKEGQKIARIDGELVIAKAGQYIIFPEKPKDVPIDTEAFSLGEKFVPEAV